MNKNEIIRLGIILGIAAIIITYFSILFVNINKGNAAINEIQGEISSLRKKIKKERKNQIVIKKTDKDFVTNAYFGKDTDYFENYIRDIFSKYRIKIKVYQSMMTEKTYSEIGVNFNVNAFDFFKLIEDIEEGKHLVVIKNLNIKKDEVPYFKVTMKLRGYYKD